MEQPIEPFRVEMGGVMRGVFVATRIAVILFGGFCAVSAVWLAVQGVWDVAWIPAAIAMFLVGIWIPGEWSARRPILAWDGATLTGTANFRAVHVPAAEISSLEYVPRTKHQEYRALLVHREGMKSVKFLVMAARHEDVLTALGALARMGMPIMDRTSRLSAEPAGPKDQARFLVSMGLLLVVMLTLIQLPRWLEGRGLTIEASLLVSGGVAVLMTTPGLIWARHRLSHGVAPEWRAVAIPASIAVLMLLIWGGRTFGMVVLGLAVGLPGLVSLGLTAVRRPSRKWRRMYRASTNSPTAGSIEAFGAKWTLERGRLIGKIGRDARPSFTYRYETLARRWLPMATGPPGPKIPANLQRTLLELGLSGTIILDDEGISLHHSNPPRRETNLQRVFAALSAIVALEAKQPTLPLGLGAT